MLDALLRERVLKRDDYTCQRCGAKPTGRALQVAHIFSRRYLTTRWSLDNVTVLCSSCHFWGHANPTEFTIWLLECGFANRVARLRALLKNPRIPDLEEVERGLRDDPL